MFKVELVDNKQTALILTNSFGKVYKLLVEILKRKNIEVFTGRVKSEKVSEFDYVFLINPEVELVKTIFPHLQKALIIFTYKTDSLGRIIRFLKRAKKRGVKMAGVSPFHSKDHLERALWFFLSKSNEIYLPLELSERKKQINYFGFIDNLKDWFSFKKLIFGGVLSFVVFNLTIWLLLFLSFFLMFTGFSQGKDGRIKKGEWFYTVSYKMYEPVKPVYHFFFIGSLTDNLFEIGEVSLKLIKKGKELSQELPEFFSLALKPQVTIEEFNQQNKLLKKIRGDITELEEEIGFLSSSLPKVALTENLRGRTKEAQEFAFLARNFFEIYDRLFPADEEREYLILFANNMELRPGGGFIGSFAVVKTRPLGVESIRFYDVYDADGQLKVHFEPPDAIKEYLNQPHWFLRDSNFSPDMRENYLTAKRFLEYEMPELKISGSVIITTSAVREILKAYGEVYLPDYKEKITADNFYIKTQFYSQNEFFPGALNKKRFLQSLLNQLLVEFDRVDPVRLFKALKAGLDQKYIAAYFEDSSLQEFFDKNYWSGRIIAPDCYVRNAKNCVLDYVFPVDANLGVNKANFYVKKKLSFEVKISSAGEVSSRFEYVWQNDSPSEIFPGGRYKNYFRLFLLKDIEPDYFEYEERKDKGFELIFYNLAPYTERLSFVDQLVLVPPGERKKITLAWKNSRKLKKGSNLYQLILQKQIGGGNFDFSFKIILPDNVYLVNQNFKPLVKKGEVLYNTYLSNDKIFFLELVKE